jgi:hypothetical protein
MITGGPVIGEHRRVAKGTGGSRPNCAQARCLLNFKG